MAFEDVKGKPAIILKARCYRVTRGWAEYYRLTCYEEWQLQAGIDPNARVTLAIGRDDDAGSFALRQRVETDAYRGYKQTLIANSRGPLRSRGITVSNPELTQLLSSFFENKKTIYLGVRIAKGYLIFTPEA